MSYKTKSYKPGSYKPNFTLLDVNSQYKDWGILDNPNVSFDSSGTSELFVGLPTTPAAQTPGFWSWDSFLGSKQSGPGWGGLGIDALTGLGNLWLGTEQLKLGKDSLSTQKKQFSDQFNMQKELIMQDFTDRENARAAANPNYVRAAAPNFNF